MSSADRARLGRFAAFCDGVRGMAGAVSPVGYGPVQGGRRDQYMMMAHPGYAGLVNALPGSTVSVDLTRGLAGLAVAFGDTPSSAADCAPDDPWCRNVMAAYAEIGQTPTDAEYNAFRHTALKTAGGHAFNADWFAGCVLTMLSKAGKTYPDGSPLDQHYCTFKNPGDGAYAGKSLDDFDGGLLGLGSACSACANPSISSALAVAVQSGGSAAAGAGLTTQAAGSTARSFVPKAVKDRLKAAGVDIGGGGGSSPPPRTPPAPDTGPGIGTVGGLAAGLLLALKFLF